MYQSHAPYLKQKLTVSQIMMRVCLALIPGIAVQSYFFGNIVIVQIALAATTALLSEAWILFIRKIPVKRVLADNSALVTALLLAIAIPPMAPWWITVLGTAFAIIVVKQLYGGLGFNIFNPAMAAYVFLLISFPIPMTQWTHPHSIADLPSFTQQLAHVFEVNMMSYDAFSGATPLDHAKTLLQQGFMNYEIYQTDIFSGLAGKGWQWVNLAYLAGGLYLLHQGVIRWHIPVALLTALFLWSATFYLADMPEVASPMIHLFSGATMLGAFFIATDPVSASTTPKGRLVYGFLIGSLVFFIRSYGGYPEAMAFAVLLINMAVPLIDHYSQPRVYGHTGAK